MYSRFLSSSASSPIYAIFNAAFASRPIHSALCSAFAATPPFPMISRFMLFWLSLRPENRGHLLNNSCEHMLSVFMIRTKIPCLSCESNILSSCSLSRSMLILTLSASGQCSFPPLRDSAALRIPITSLKFFSSSKKKKKWILLFRR